MAGGGNSIKKGLFFLHISGSVVSALPTKKCSMASDELISEEIRCEQKSIYKTTINYIL